MGQAHDDREDFEFIREALGDVQPLKGANRTESRAPRPRPVPRQSQKDEAAVKAELLNPPEPEPGLETGEELLYLRPGYQKRYLTRLRRGHYSIGDSLDLHQMNEATASRALLDFVQSASASGIGCVRIVHGKGLRSRSGPKLKAMTRRLLSKHPRVIAFASCRPFDGGTGAVSVLLKTG